MKLLQRINNLSILFKTGLIVFFPLASLSVMLIENLQRDSLVVEDVVRVTEMVTWLGVLDDLTHLLALERGLTVGMSSGKEKEWKKHLVTHRKLVDRQIQHFLIVLKEADLSSMAPALQQLMSELKKGFQQLEELRLAADQRQPGAGSVENVFDYFSRLNKAALYLIQGMTLSVQDMEISRQLQMMTALLWLKERAGQERAVLRQLLLGVVV
ncbi:MAG: nitrate- and nitrite sensing domain-containing protein, partial [Gammaproteobacteria bacterium]|nr:nitrate- and nitrite sensing domain-containing protein [Gammaproteobacteria bacterium]